MSSYFAVKFGMKTCQLSVWKCKKLGENVIYAHFNAIKGTHLILRHLFSKNSTKENRNIAERERGREREQFPLMLGYGITIHNAQGMTLENVSVHCKGVFQAGQ